MVVIMLVWETMNGRQGRVGRPLNGLRIGGLGGLRRLFSREVIPTTRWQARVALPSTKILTVSKPLPSRHDGHRPIDTASQRLKTNGPGPDWVILDPIGPSA